MSTKKKFRCFFNKAHMCNIFMPCDNHCKWFGQKVPPVIHNVESCNCSVCSLARQKNKKSLVKAKDANRCLYCGGPGIHLNSAGKCFNCQAG